MFWAICLILLSCCCHNTRSEMEAFVVGGAETNIQNYPHSAFLEMTCPTIKSGSSWICGSSIINQQFLLTAAHCTVECESGGAIVVVVGSEYRTKGTVTYGYKFRVHQDYDDGRMANDIALVKVKHTLELSAKVQRVILVKNIDLNKEAYVAGWGMIDEYKSIGSTRLKHAKQKLMSRSECSGLLKENLAPGVLCAGTFKGKDYAAAGDSGCALVVDGYVQIGIVSYKIPDVSQSLVVYTDVRYYYDWINQNTKSMYCG